MLVSVVLPCFNGAGTLGVMLDSLVRQTYSGDWELVFVNNGSTDNSVEIAMTYADRLPIRVVNAYSGTGPQGSTGHSYFVGFQAAKGDVILVCESDDECDPQWMQHMVKALETNDFVVPALEYERLNPPSMTWGPDGGLQTRSSGLPAIVGPLHLPYAVCNAIGMTRGCYERVGPPTDWMGPSWDVDYSWRVHFGGMKLTFVPEALVHYRLRTTAKARFRQARSWGRGQANLHIRYGMKPLWRYLAFSLFQLARSVVRLVLGTLSRRRPFAYWAFDVGFAWGQLESIPKLLKARLSGVTPDSDIISGRQPAGPQTLVSIPAA